MLVNGLLLEHCDRAGAHAQVAFLSCFLPLCICCGGELVLVGLFSWDHSRALDLLKSGPVDTQSLNIDLSPRLLARGFWLGVIL